MEMYEMNMNNDKYNLGNNSKHGFVAYGILFHLMLFFFISNRKISLECQNVTELCVWRDGRSAMWDR